MTKKLAHESNPKCVFPTLEAYQTANEPLLGKKDQERKQMKSHIDQGSKRLLNSLLQEGSRQGKTFYEKTKVRRYIYN